MFRIGVLLLFLGTGACGKIIGLRTANGTVDPWDGSAGAPEVAFETPPADLRGDAGLQSDRPAVEANGDSAVTPEADAAGDRPANADASETDTAANPDVNNEPACRDEAREGVAVGIGNLGPMGAAGVCSYPLTRLSVTRSYAALDGRLINSAFGCGACVRISNSSRTVVQDVQIVDVINHDVPANRYALGLEPAVRNRFSATGNPVVNFEFIPCEVEGNIRTTFDSATQVNTSVLVMNHRTRIARIQINVLGRWVDLVRRLDHRWTVPGPIEGGASQMIFTDVYGRQVLAPMVPFVGDYQDAGVQLPVCPAPKRTLLDPSGRETAPTLGGGYRTTISN
jgi:hypothetical protein